MKKKDSYKLEDVFTPCQPACLTYIERINQKRLLDRAFRTPGKQIIIYGHSKVGKTTILNEKIRIEKLKHIKSQCMDGVTINDLIIDAFNKLDIFYTGSREVVESTSISATISAAYLSIKATIKGKIESVEKTSSNRAVDFPVTPQNLAQFIGATGNCWIIEDFHKIEINEKKKMSQIMKVFMDQAADYPTLKIIAIGAVNSAREVVRYDPELRDRISEIEIPLMGVNELKSILTKGQELLNISIDESIINSIVHNSCGLPIVTHDLAYLLCDVNEIQKTYNSNKKFAIPNKTFETAVEEYLNQNSDSYKLIYETATKVTSKRHHDNPLDIINALLDTNNESVTIDELLQQLKRVNPSYKGENILKHTEELTLTTRCEILRYNKDSMSYFFSNPFIKAYFKCMRINSIKSNPITNSDILRVLSSTTLRELESARSVFIQDLGTDDLDFDYDYI